MLFPTDRGFLFLQFFFQACRQIQETDEQHQPKNVNKMGMRIYLFFKKISLDNKWQRTVFELGLKKKLLTKDSTKKMK
jgi:hypothetical protein